ncbi:AEC family transporter [Secundilactobacillus odoratitofui]|uniref:AEC family transporter n=1 Tax=Secundilactobacillus odoratitofui TaxID=480930 RepID=UPI000705476F|nr:AEC family transporter [Secundilactobacillus odoratitofui]
MLTVFLVSLNSVLIILTIILVGFLLKKTQLVSDAFSSDVSNLLIDVALPVSILLSTQRYINRNNFVLLAIGTLLIMIAILICFGVSIMLSRMLHLPQSTRSIFVNGFVNSNTLFVGLPLNLALFGNQSLPYFLCYFIANTIATWGIGVKFIYRDTPENLKPEPTASKIKRFLNLLTPPMWGFVVGLIFFVINLQVRGFLQQSFVYLSNLVTPLALIFLGLQLARTKLTDLKLTKIDVVAQVGKFVVSPLVMFLVIVVAQHYNIVSMNSMFVKTLIVQAATPMLTALPVLAEQAHLDVVFPTRILTESILIFPFAVIVIMMLV